MQEVLHLGTNRSVEELRLSTRWSKDLQRNPEGTTSDTQKGQIRILRSVASHLCEVEFVNLLADAFLAVLHGSGSFRSMKGNDLRALQNNTTLRGERCESHIRVWHNRIELDITWSSLLLSSSSLKGRTFRYTRSCCCCSGPSADSLWMHKTLYKEMLRARRTSVVVTLPVMW